MKDQDMLEFNEQVARIREKLPEAKKADKDLKVFGAGRHQYRIYPPASASDVHEFEKKIQIELPECYKSFITQIGNGGPGYANSAAGPYYGIFPLGVNTDDLVYDQPEMHFKYDCLLDPEMTDKEWKSLAADSSARTGSSNDHSKQSLILYGGILPVGSQGCTYLHGIVLNGKFKGRVVNLDMNGQKPQFACGNNFLDWYERWLDEVISGELIQENPVWFGFILK